MESAEVCLVNIGPRQRRKRALIGVVAIGLGLAGAALLMALGVHRLWRLALFLPIVVGAFGVFQARAKT